MFQRKDFYVLATRNIFQVAVLQLSKLEGRYSLSKLQLDFFNENGFLKISKLIFFDGFTPNDLRGNRQLAHCTSW
jgi:hypothetical protein